MTYRSPTELALFSPSLWPHNILPCFVNLTLQLENFKKQQQQNNKTLAMPFLFKGLRYTSKYFLIKVQSSIPTVGSIRGKMNSLLPADCCVGIEEALVLRYSNCISHKCHV